MINIGLTIFCFLLSLILTLLLGRKNWKVNRYVVPSIWTTIGIGGTFAALLLNILLVQDIKDINLLFIRDFASAFGTSLIGILGSLFFKWKIASEEYKESQELDTQTQTVEQTSERVYLHQIATILKETQKEHAQEKQLWKDSQDALHGKLDLINQSIEKMDKIFDGLTNKLVKNINNQLAPTLEGVAQEAMEQVNLNLEVAQKQHVEQSEKLFAKLEEVLTQSISKVVGESKDQFTELKDFHKDQATALKDFYAATQKQITGTNKELHDQAKALQQHQQDQMQQMNVFYKNMQDSTQDTQKEYRVKLQEQSQSFERSISAYEAKMFETMQAHLSDIEKIFERIDHWQRQNKQYIEGLNKSFNKAVLQFDKSTQHQEDGAKIIANFDKSMQRLQGQIDEMLTSNKQTIQKFKEQSEEIMDINVVVEQLGNIKHLLRRLDSYFEVNNN